MICCDEVPLKAVVAEGLGKRIDTYLTRAKAFGFVGSVLISKGDDILLYKGYGLANKVKQIPFTHETIIDIGSLSKQFTATAILDLEQQGLLDTDMLLAQFFDNIPLDKQQITLHHMLTHSSGFPLKHGSDWEFYERAAFIRDLLSVPLLFKPGSQYSYSNSAFSLLAIIIENLTGKTFQEYLTNRFFKPLGMDKTGWYGDTRFTEEEVAHVYVEGKDGGSPKTWPGPFVPLLGNGGICCPIGDLYKWMQAIKKQHYLTPNLTQKLFKPFLEDTAYGWDVREIEQGKRIWHNGGTDTGANSELTWFFDLDILMIIFSNEILMGEDSGYMVTRPIKKILFNKPYVLPPILPKQNSITKLEKYTGFYENHDKIYYRIWVQSEYLLLSPMGQEAIDQYIFPEGSPKNYGLYDAGSHRIVQDLIHDKFEYFRSLVLDENRFPILRLNLQRFLRSAHDTLGSYNEFKVLGTTPFKENSEATWIKLLHENGETGFGIVWEREGILRITESFYPYPVIVPLLPESSIIFLGHNLFFNKTMHIEFDQNNGDIDGFSLIKGNDSIYVQKRAETQFT